jgi:hypothetical protein
MNAQLGIMTLREFFTALPNFHALTYTRTELTTAWNGLSSFEREELDLGRAQAWNAAAVHRNKNLEHRIWLGSITLATFLELLGFDGKGVTNRGQVIDAWFACADQDEVQLIAHMGR